ncbi:hypothetical protein BG015_011737 [Linnemannia schmuckeri]|uniref:Zn(2)-C6 fungal-type domain-containing protein n=1 Tax=Linnemannia schmuckeri TaxID=64567 RepID=A0A9P5VEA1_9FUNG|nr:hypothetical protein BG015_011737 [Linnemannia schmuckeri]
MAHPASPDFLATATGLPGTGIHPPSSSSSGTTSETTQSRHLLKCDGGVPCASCLKKNVDCRYTDAQLSRATWGDSLLSDEKVSGVVADKPKSQLFYTGVSPLQSHDLRSQAIRSQSKHHSRLIRVAHPAIQSWANGGFQEPLSGTTVGQSQPSSVINPALEHYATKGSHVLQQDHPGHHHHDQIMDKEYIKARRVQKMAKDLIDIKRSEYALLIPRHILHEDDELFLIRNPQTNPKPQRILSRLMIVPRDANYLVEIFFENAHFYYPVLNRAVVELCLVESHTPDSMLLLNTVFMVACKHLPRVEDTMRAIEFRERIRELRWCIEDRTQLNFMLAEMMGFMAVYGLFGITPGMMEYCGTHRTFASRNSGTQLSNPETELLEEGFPKGSPPEVNHQNKLWLFWAHYLRDSISKLYFGFYFGVDAKPLTAELPKIKNFVGLGGRIAPSVQSAPAATEAAAAATKRRREVFAGPCTAPSDKRFLPDPEVRAGGELSGRTKFHSTQAYSAGTDSSGDDKGSMSARSEGDHGVVMPSHPLNGVEPPSGAGGANSSGRKVATLSKKVLEAQNRGNSILREMSETAETLDPEALETHMERMEILLRSQEDPTDGGSYARALFLEEVRLWIIGRRISAYLASRTTGGTPHHPVGLSGLATKDSNDTSSSAQEKPGFWSEQAWKEDLELRNLQADLIAWEKAVPDHLKFRLDVDHPNINQKVNGKYVTIVMMSYYTITIFLQMSYLPVRPDPSHPKLSSKKASPRASDHAKSNKDADSHRDANGSQRLGSRSRSTSDISKEPLRSSNAPPNAPASSTRSTPPLSTIAALTRVDGDEYYNTPHRICTELANVIFHHVEIMLDRYTEWCSIQAKINHALIAAQRVVCLNVQFERNSCTMRNEAKAAFKMGSALYKRLAMLPAPLVIYDRPPEEDLNYMNDLDKAFHQMVVSQNEERENWRLSEERGQQQEQEVVEEKLEQRSNTVLNSFVLDTNNQDGISITDEINSHSLESFEGEMTEGYAFEFEETSISMKGSFSFLLDPHSITE